MELKIKKDKAEEEDLAQTGWEEIVAASSTILPSLSLQGLWQSLIYDTNVKEKLLHDIETSLFLAEKKVDPIRVGINRVVLLHGPPGSGKTSLCKALAQKLFIKMAKSKRFDNGVLVEIISHNLFSGKLVQKMFEEIQSKVNNPRTFVFILIDEVETLTAACKNSESSLKCSDAVLVLNVLLTEIDKVKQHTNVLILTTSNITGFIDLGFVDRADIKQYVSRRAAVYVNFGAHLEDEIESMESSEMKNTMSGNLPWGNVRIHYLISKLNKDESEKEDLAETGCEAIVTASSTLLPSVSLRGLWKSLIYDTNVKENIFSNIHQKLFLDERKVEPTLFGFNRVVLLHGPPGSGKTSLCKALAQILTIRMIKSNRYDDGVLFEINSNSLFSNWFSESGNLMQKMFEEIKNKVNNPRTFVFVLIDEVESLMASRKNSRVMTALLNEIKEHINVLILTTSNTALIDLGFVYRADIMQYVDLPILSAVYKIYLDSIWELDKKGVINFLGVMDMHIKVLWRVARMSEGFSGRTLRKIPFHALAMIPKLSGGIDIEIFLESMKTAVKNEKKKSGGIQKFLRLF